MRLIISRMAKRAVLRLVEWTVAFCAALLVRIGYFTGKHLYFDGDEAIIGIMATDILEGKFWGGSNIPVYLYGQVYGFSLLEVLPVAFFQAWMGPGVYPLKLGALALFSIGAVLFYHLARRENIRKPALLVLLMIMVLSYPPLFLWATKVRGGYITAWVAVTGLFYLLTAPGRSFRQWQMMAALAAIIAVSHVLFLLPVLPLLIFRIYREWNFQTHLAVAAWGGFFFILLYAPSQFNENYWLPRHFTGFSLDNLGLLNEGIGSYFAGVYNLSNHFSISSAFKVQLSLLALASGGVVIFALRRGRDSDRPVLGYLALGIILSLVPVFFLNQLGGRFLLPFFTGFMFLTFWGAIICLKNPGSEMARWFVPVLAGISLAAAPFYRHTPSYWLEKEADDLEMLDGMMDGIRRSGIQHFYCSDPMLTWQINYLGSGEVYARFLGKQDRLSRFIHEVDACEKDTSCETAIIGFHWPLQNMHHLNTWSQDTNWINQRAYILQGDIDKYLDYAGYER